MLTIETPEDLLKLDAATLLSTWKNLNDQLTKMKLLENTARTLCAKTFFDPRIKEGTLKYPVGAHHELVIVKKLNHKLSPEKAAVENVQDMLMRHSEAGTIAAKALFKTKLELDVKTYKNLPTELQDIVNNVVVISEATPTLELKVK